MAIFIREILLTIKDKPMARCFGLMDRFIRANGRMVFRMVRDKFI